MTYEEWLALIDLLKKSPKKEYIEKLTNEPVNENLKAALVPKIKSMVTDRFENIINNIIKSLEYMYEDENILDIELVNFRKSIKQIIELIDNKYLTDQEKEDLRKTIKEQTEETYKILERDSINHDEEGIFYQIIKNNRIKWSDNNEL